MSYFPSALAERAGSDEEQWELEPVFYTGCWHRSPAAARAPQMVWSELKEFPPGASWQGVFLIEILFGRWEKPSSFPAVISLSTAVCTPVTRHSIEVSPCTPHCSLVQLLVVLSFSRSVQISVKGPGDCLPTLPCLWIPVASHQFRCMFLNDQQLPVGAITPSFGLDEHFGAALREFMRMPLYFKRYK